jgi:hypothetical protein
MMVRLVSCSVKEDKRDRERHHHHKQDKKEGRTIV